MKPQKPGQKLFLSMKKSFFDIFSFPQRPMYPTFVSQNFRENITVILSFLKRDRERGDFANVSGRPTFMTV
jgi:hypothetical protein